MSYELVFDVAEGGYRNWPFPCAGLPFLVIGFAMIWFRRRHPDPSRSRWRRLQPYLFTGFAVFWTSVSFVGTYVAYRGLASALERGDYVTVEGVVTRFVPMPATGHPHESFEVSGRRYEYSDFVVVPGFNRTQSNGGPVREGLRVRIADVRGAIARLEIAR